MSVLLAYAEKSIMTSALSAGPSSSACLSTIPNMNIKKSLIQVTGWFCTTTGAGRKPPSVPIRMNDGPMKAGSGTPPSLPSVGQPEGKPDVATAGTMPTSVLLL